MTEIETARLRLRRFVPEDLDDLCRLLADPRVMRYVGVEAGYIFSREETEAALATFITGWARRGYGRWAVVEKATGRFAGLCGFRLFDGEAELLYLLHVEYWGQGLASEAARASLRYAFEELRLTKVVAVTRPEHTASRRVLERVGMRYEGEVCSHGVELVSYTMTSEEFKPDDAPYAVRQCEPPPTTEEGRG